MAIDTYANLKIATARWIGGSDSSDATSLGFSSTIDDIVTIAEARIFREARTIDTEASINTAISAGVIGVPSDYIALKFAYVDGTPVRWLERRSAEWIYNKYGTRTAVGPPSFIAREAGNFIFGPYPDSGYTIKGVYWKKLAALSTGVHNLFLLNPDLYLFGCLAESAILIGNDKRIPLWEQKYQSILAAVNGHARQEDVSGGSLSMRIA
jgi:hypothetical protein